MIFQEPMTSLDPLYRIGDQIIEPLRHHRRMSRSAARERALEMLRLVRIPEPERRMRAYPHELSGGQRQRVMIAMALAGEPDVLIADEPTTALDVTVQAQIMKLLDEVREEFGTAMILITHDLGIVADSCERTVVMYGGRVMEQGPTGPLFARPTHPYTLGLLKAVPRLDRDSDTLETIPGDPPDMSKLPKGCPFAPRCAWAMDVCRQVQPPLEPCGPLLRACHADPEAVK